MSNENHAEAQARAQVASIVAMVAALQCDYDRLEELRELRDDESMPICFDTGSPLTQSELEELTELEEQAGECTSEEEARQRIEEDALSVEVRSGWHTPGERIEEPEEFRIVLCTGGPHVEIVGDLDRGQPSRARILYRDWGTSEELFDFDRDVVLTYCACFYFGE